MKKLSLKIIVFLILLLLVSFGLSRAYDDSLTDEDYSLEKTGPEDYVISIPDKNFYSYNVWRCFSASSIEIKTSTVDYDGWHEVPSIDIHMGTAITSYDLDPDIRWDVELVLDRWKFLAEDVESFCIFGVFMQKIDTENELWYIEQIKTTKGYWKREDFLDYLSPEFKEYNVEALKRWEGE